MKKYLSLVIALAFFQSCHTYKATSISDIEKGKTYKVTLQNGQKIESQCQTVNEENIAFEINQKIVEVPKSNIVEAKKKKISVLKVATGLTAATVAVFLLVDNADKDTFLELTTSN